MRIPVRFGVVLLATWFGLAATTIGSAQDSRPSLEDVFGAEIFSGKVHRIEKTDLLASRRRAIKLIRSLRLKSGQILELTRVADLDPDLSPDVVDVLERNPTPFRDLITTETSVDGWTFIRRCCLLACVDEVTDEGVARLLGETVAMPDRSPERNIYELYVLGRSIAFGGKRIRSEALRRFVASQLVRTGYGLSPMSSEELESFVRNGMAQHLWANVRGTPDIRLDRRLLKALYGEACRDSSFYVDFLKWLERGHHIDTIISILSPSFLSAMPSDRIPVDCDDDHSGDSDIVRLLRILRRTDLTASEIAFVQKQERSIDPRVRALSRFGIGKHLFSREILEAIEDVGLLRGSSARPDDGLVRETLIGYAAGRKRFADLNEKIFAMFGEVDPPRRLVQSDGSAWFNEVRLAIDPDPRHWYKRFDPALTMAISEVKRSEVPHSRNMTTITFDARVGDGQATRAVEIVDATPSPASFDEGRGQFKVVVANTTEPEKPKIVTFHVKSTIHHRSWPANAVIDNAKIAGVTVVLPPGSYDIFCCLDFNRGRAIAVEKSLAITLND